MKVEKIRKRFSDKSAPGEELHDKLWRALPEKLWERCLDWLFPRRCALCDRVLKKTEKLVCRSCGAGIRRIEGPRCFHCGKPLQREEREYCRGCAGRASFFERGLAPFVYGGDIQESLMRFKYGGRQEYARFYAAMIDRSAGAAVCGVWRPEILVPIPLHARRYRKRGYNQAEVLARELSLLWNIPVDSGCISRVRNTKAQKGLGAAERKKNLREAFALTREGAEKKYGCILLVDDIYTTGSTAEAAARVFREHGAGRVYIVTVCVGGGP